MFDDDNQSFLSQFNVAIERIAEEILMDYKLNRLKAKAAKDYRPRYLWRLNPERHCLIPVMASPEEYETIKLNAEHYSHSTASYLLALGLCQPLSSLQPKVEEQSYRQLIKISRQLSKLPQEGTAQEQILATLQTTLDAILDKLEKHDA